MIKRVNGRKKIHYTYSHELRHRLFNPSLYARISLSMQNKFSSKHALALYELCVDYFIARKCQGQSPFIPLDAFRKVMGINDHEYKEFKFLKQWIIKKPLSEINIKSDLLVRVEYKKEKRKIVALKFHISLAAFKGGAMATGCAGGAANGVAACSAGLAAHAGGLTVGNACLAGS